jgi:hypothetical protein
MWMWIRNGTAWSQPRVAVPGYRVEAVLLAD